MTRWLKNNMSIVWWWAALIAAAAVIFVASRGTGFAQLGVGLLSASLALLAAMALFEVIWQLLSKPFAPSDDNTPSHRAGGRRRPQP